MAVASDTRMKVFVAHAAADAGFADQLGAFLGSNGFTPLTSADDVRSAVRTFILEADAVVVVLTARAMSSDACMWEIDQAIELGKRIIPVLPEPFGASRTPDELADLNFVYWYSDPAVPNSGFFDGQRRLLAALRVDGGWSRKQADLLAQASRWVMSGRSPELLLRGPAVEQAIVWREGAPQGARAMEIVEEFILASFEWQTNKASRQSERARQLAAERDERKAKDRERKQEKRREREERALGRRLAEAQLQAHLPPRPRVRFPMFRVTILGAFAAAVIAVIFVPGLPGRLRSMISEASSAVNAIAPEEEPYSPMQVSAEEFNPGRDLVAGRGGANVRDYPLTSGDLLANVPAGTRLRVNGRLKVQGQWWFRVVMPDERVGFVREDVVRWTAPERTNVAAAASVTAIEPAVAVTAGRAGANLRTQPRRGATSLVRLPAGAAMNATGKVRDGAHWWLRVQLDDGRNGFVRDDVITAESRASLSL